MEVSLMQSSGLRCLQSLLASTSGDSSVHPSNALVAGRNFTSRKCVPIWKRVSEFGQQQRSVRRASSGGTRRDQQKIVAKTKRRRSRHVKGVTPTKDELLDQLAEEEEADEELDRTFPVVDEENESDSVENEGISSSGIRDDAEDDSLVLQEKPSRLPESDEDQYSADLEKYWETIGNLNSESLGLESSSSSKDLKVENERWDQGTGKDGETSSSGKEEIIENDDNSFTIRFTPEGDLGVAQDQVNGVASTVQEGINQAGSVASQISDSAQDAAENVSDTAQNTLEGTAKNLQEAEEVFAENVEGGIEQAGSVVEELANTAQDTARDVGATIQETAEDSAGSLSEAGDAIVEGLSDVGSQGITTAREVADSLEEKFRDGQEEAGKDLSELRRQAEVAGERAGGALEKIAAEAGKSAENVGDSVTDQVVDAAGTAGMIVGEAFRLGEVAVNAVGEAAGFTQETGSANGSGSRLDDSVEETSKNGVLEGRPGRGSIDSQKEVPSEAGKLENEGPYTGLKVTVAGATGRTGRLIVEELVRRGVPVRAMVRDPAKARDLGRMSNVEVVKADLYNYEAVKRVLGDSNVVICAIGASGLPFDPIGTYQAEFEGVKNLVAAAKNGGKVKKFVFITTIGVSFLQIVPLIFWKKQAELYLQRSGLDYTIIRPGGLKNGVDKGETVLMKPADSQFGGSITRKKVAELCVDAVITPEASEKVVEVVSGGRGGQTPAELFGNI